MHASFKAIILTTAAYLSLSAIAADNTVTTTGNLPPTAAGTTDTGSTTLTHEEAKDLKTQSKAEYKARKKVADANKDLDIADCKTSGLETKDERDCKHAAKQAAKDAKHDAKEDYKEQKSEIKAHTP